KGHEAHHHTNNAVSHASPPSVRSYSTDEITTNSVYSLRYGCYEKREACEEQRSSPEPLQVDPRPLQEIDTQPLIDQQGDNCRDREHRRRVHRYRDHRRGDRGARVVGAWANTERH